MTNTPWGGAQSQTTLAPGITFYSTASHGGFRVAPELLATMPAPLAACAHPSAGWFEEDCAWSAVAVAFPDAFKPAERERAESILRDWHPDAWESHFGRVLMPGESHVKDETAARTPFAVAMGWCTP